MRKITGYGIPLKAAVIFTAAVLVSLSVVFPSRVIAADTAEIDCPQEYAERYVIKVGTFAELSAIAENVNQGINDYQGMTIALTANIKASSGIDSYKSGFSPIGTKEHPFRGIFDGCGHTVTLQLPSTSAYGPGTKNAVGLFGYAEHAVIRNVTVSGSIQSTEKAGGIAAYAYSTEILNCINTASLKGSSVGGIAAVISGTQDVPSVVGNCANKATTFTSLTVSGYSGGFGGIVGRMEGNDSFVRNCYSSRNVSEAKIGGIVGYADGNDPVMRVENSYYLAKNESVRGVSGKDDVPNYVTVIDSSRASQSESEEGSLAFLMNRYIDLKELSEQYGRWSYQSSSKFFLIESKGKAGINLVGSVEDWNRIATASREKPLYGTYLLTADISGITQMLGSPSQPFRGALLGAGHTVSVNISSNSECTGIISYAEKANVLDVTVKGTINAANSVGAVIGRAVDTHISGCSSAVRISGITDVGGIIGMAKGGCRIESCRCDPASNGSGFEVGGGVTCGGIVGLLSDDSVVEWSDNYAEVRSSSRYVGGIVGCMQKNSFVHACCNYGSAAGTHHIGGIVGCVEGGKGVEGCYTQATVKASENNAGGILTGTAGGVPVRNCINVGAVVSNDPKTQYSIANPEEKITLCYALDLNIPSVSAMIGDGTLADYFDLAIDNSGIGNLTYWQAGDGTAFVPVTVRPQAKHSLNMVSAEPYTISDADDFRLFGTLISFDTMKNKSWKLGADLAVSKDDLVQYPFSGTFDGDGHTVTIHSTAGGLFSEVSGTIRNLNITGSVSGSGNLGAFAGKLINGSLISCQNHALVTGSGSVVGGLTGSIEAGTLRDCSNDGMVTGNGKVGGIFGVGKGKITVASCRNTGKIHSGADGAGGIGGGTENGTLKISLAENNGAVCADEVHLKYFGGILGYTGAATDIEYSINNAAITYRNNSTESAASDSFGGILGGAAGNVRIALIGCGNFGTISCDSENDGERKLQSIGKYFGGMIGNASASHDSTITLCVNDAPIYGNSDLGGIVGISSPYTEYYDCYNASFVYARSNYNAGTICGNAVGQSGHNFTTNACTFQSGSITVGNPWNYGLDTPHKTLEYLLHQNHKNDGCLFGWSIDADGHCHKAEWSAIEKAPDYSRDNPYVIKDNASYRLLQFLISSGLDFAGQYVRLDANLTIQSALIAKDAVFHGVFDGNGKTVTLDANGDGNGVFGTLSGAAVKNLKVAGSIKAGNLRGGFAQTASAASFENCESSVTIGTPGCSGDDCGGFAGTMTNGCLIVGGKSTAVVYGGNRVGGFVGAMYGGEVSNITSDSSQSPVKGLVSGKENVGGFAGKTTDLTVRNAALRPIVNGVRYVGGLIGDAYNCVITSCSVTTGTNNNHKWIYASICSAGGIVGITCNSNINNCKVYALIWAQDTGAGGIAGTCYPPTTICKCTVEGGIYGNDRIGGILGDAWNTEAGGLVAIDECTVATKYPAEPGGYVAIASHWSTGGIVGYTNAYTAVKYCINSSALWSSNSDSGITPYVGGIVAYSDAPSITVMNCLNEGYLESQNGVIGGIVAHASCAYLYNDVNTGTMRRAKYFAGIVCELGSTDMIKNCANAGEIVLSYSSSPVAYTFCQLNMVEKCWHCAAKDFSGNGGSWFGGIYLWGDYVPYAEMALFLNNGINDAAPDSYDWLPWEHDGNTRLYPKPISLNQLTGNGTEQSPYLLSDSDDFDAISQLINTGVIPGNVYIRLERSFDMIGFIPIGNEQYPFKGNFDGRGYRITVSVKNRPTRMNGVFGYLDGANIHDLTVGGEFLLVGSDSGRLAGIAVNSVISDCVCVGTFSTDINAARCGGIVGSALGSTRIIGCRSTGTINQFGKRCGGICGSAGNNVQIIDCVNESSIGTCLGECGGIVGSIYNNAKIIRCRNNGEFKQITDDTCGGICGLIDNSGQVLDCRNYGNMTIGKETSNMGGIVGAMHGFGRIERCVNEGTLTVESGKGRIGGIVGISDYRDPYSGHHEIQIVNCTNYGDIVNPTHTIDDVGGIAGYSSGTIVACVNNGNVEGNTAVGGIVGYEYFDTISTSRPTHEAFYFCINTGKVVGGNETGGIYGGSGPDWVVDHEDVIGCISAGTVTYQTLDSLYAKTGVDPRNTAYRVPGIDRTGKPTTVFRYGMGTESDPYLIGDIRELEMLALQTSIGNTNGGFAGEYFKLTCDLPESTYLLPIGSKTAFAGTFDGGGKTIAINALLGMAKFTPEGVKNAFIYGIRDHLALFAETDGAVIKNLRVSGSVNGFKNEDIQNDASYVGGIVAAAKNTTIRDCQTDASVRGGTIIGGIVGCAEKVSLENCICRSEIEGNRFVGGIVGEIIGDCSFVNCIGAASTKAADGTAGAFAGTIEKGGKINWNGNFLVTGRTVDTAIALGASPYFAHCTPSELVNKAVLSPYYRTQETGICLKLFYTDDPHGRADAAYPAVKEDYVRDGSIAYYRCNSCGNYYTDAAHQHVITEFDKWYNAERLIQKYDESTSFTVGVAKGEEIETTRFHTSEDFVKYLSEHQTTEFQLITLGGDITTSFPVTVKKATINLCGHTWMTTGDYDAAIVDKSPVVNNQKYCDNDKAEDNFNYIFYNRSDGTVIYGGGGTIASDGTSHSLISFCNLRICDTTLRGAKAENGAALHGVEGVAQTIEIVGCKIYDCHAGWSGGAVSMNGNNQNLRIHLQNTEIYDCSADQGGAICCDSGHVSSIRFIGGSIHDCSAIYGGGISIGADYFVRIYGDEPTPSNCLITDCQAKARGGAVFVRASKTKITGIEMIGNYTSDAYGPQKSNRYCSGEGVPDDSCEGGALFIDASDVIVYADNFALNSAGYVGGAISCSEDVKNLKLDSCRFYLDVVPVPSGSDSGIGYELYLPKGKIDLNNITVHPVYGQTSDRNMNVWFHTGDGNAYDMMENKVYVNNGVTGASAFDDVTPGILIGTAGVGIAALAGVAVLAVIRRKKKETAADQRQTG